MTMYQIQYTSGNEILVKGNLGKIIDANHKIKYVGTVEQCEKWLRERACRPLQRAQEEGAE
jgi:hypothetical protein